MTQWKGYDAKDATWETKFGVRNAKLVRDFKSLWEKQQISKEAGARLAQNLDKARLKYCQNRDEWRTHVKSVLQNNNSQTTHMTNMIAKVARLRMVSSSQDREE